MFHFHSCAVSTTGKIIVVEENTRKFTALNKKRKSILKVQVDGCLEIPGRKCDWLLIAVDDHSAHFIELKGCELKHALSQLEITIKRISNPGNNYIDKDFRHIHAYAILSRCPVDSAKIQKQKKLFKKKLDADLIVRNRQFTTEL